MSPRSTSPNDIIYLRSNRKAGWFWLHNELVDVFAPLAGPYGIAVYICLVRRCEGNSALTQWSLRELERVWRDELTPPSGRPALGRSSIARALSQLLAAGMIRVEKPATRSDGPVYVIPDLNEVAHSLTPDIREKLIARLEGQRERQGVPVGDTVEGSCVPVGDTQNLCKTSGKASGKTAISTEIPGTQVSPTEPQVSPTGTLLFKDNKQETPPLPPQGGALSENSLENHSNRRYLSARWNGLLDDLGKHLMAANGRIAGKFAINPLTLWAVLQQTVLVDIHERGNDAILFLESPCPGDAKHALDAMAVPLARYLPRWFNPSPTAFSVNFPKPCGDCVDGRCTMNCGPAVFPLNLNRAPGEKHDPQQTGAA